MPIKSSAINLREIFCRVYKREQDRVELTLRRACLLAAQDRGDQDSHSLSDEDRSAYRAVGGDDASLDEVVEDERLLNLICRSDWYKQAAIEIRKQEFKVFRRSLWEPTTWEVMRDAFAEAASRCSVGFFLRLGEDLDGAFGAYCEWLSLEEGTPDARFDRAFVALDEAGFRDELWKELDDKCCEESQDLGLGKPPGGGQGGAGGSSLTPPTPSTKSPDKRGRPRGSHTTDAKREAALARRWKAGDHKTYVAFALAENTSDNPVTAKDVKRAVDNDRKRHRRK